VVKPDARREEIISLAATQPELSVEELAGRFEVTTSTIRRDLARLSAEGRLARTYGGAIARRSHVESSFEERRSEAAGAKQAMAACAAELVTPGDTVLLDAGTSCAALAQTVRSMTPLTVATVGLGSLQALAGADGVDVIALGGRLRHLSQGFVGALAEMALERLTFDICFLGTDAVSSERGICEASLEQIRLKELMVRVSSRVVVLAHSAKLDERPFHAWIWPGDRWTLITDDGVTDDQLRRFAARGVEVLVAERHSDHDDVVGRRVEG